MNSKTIQELLFISADKKETPYGVSASIFDFDFGSRRDFQNS